MGNHRTHVEGTGEAWSNLGLLIQGVVRHVRLKEA